MCESLLVILIKNAYAATYRLIVKCDALEGKVYKVLLITYVFPTRAAITHILENAVSISDLDGAPAYNLNT